MRGSRWLSLALGFFVTIPGARAQQGPFIGLDLGYSQPVNDNYRAHVDDGGTANPFFGYMLNDYVGGQGQFHFTFQEPDPNVEGLEGTGANQTTVLFGATGGPRFALPLGDVLEVYATGQGGIFTALNGRLKSTAPGFSVGGGLDFRLTRNLTLGGFARWNRVYMSPKPETLPNLVPDEQGPSDARWATAGLAIKYSFARPEEPPPPPPPTPRPRRRVAKPTPKPVMKRRIVLRSVHFDFDKSDIRPDALPVLDEAVEILKEESGVRVTVEGHTDSRGTDAYNLGLSYRRADSVRRYLLNGGISPDRIGSEGFGESRPVASNETDEGRAQNRRVELNVR
jgi:outer membrane protein OmpA-like peptidoglycan-associated protein